MARKRRTSPSLLRRQPSKTLGHVHWVYCEGATEEHCLDQLRQAWRISTLNIQLVGQVGVPWTIVDVAKAKRDELSKRKTGEWTVHVVFDQDEHPKFREAIKRAQDLKLSIGVSVPCFELWAILLHRDQTASIHRHDAPDPPVAPTLPDRGGLVGLGGREASQGPPHLAPADHCGHYRRPGNFWR